MAEIEITPEMIDAGQEAFWRQLDSDGEDCQIVTSVYRAMFAARQQPNDAEIEALARKAMDELYGTEVARMGTATTCCYDFGIPAVVKALREAIAAPGSEDTTP